MNVMGKESVECQIKGRMFGYFKQVRMIICEDEFVYLLKRYKKEDAKVEKYISIRRLFRIELACDKVLVLLNLES